MEFKRKDKIKDGISDVWVPNPPSDCMRIFVIDGDKYCDIVLCSYYCPNPCESYFKHSNEIKRKQKEIRARQREAEAIPTTIVFKRKRK